MNSFNLNINRIIRINRINRINRIKKINKIEIEKTSKSILNKNNDIEITKIQNITILINSYNPEKNDLLNSVNSCLQQIKVNVFIIIITVEDDITINIYNDYLKENNKIKLLIINITEHPGKGPKGIYYQLNKGFENVNTRFVSYFSSNDIMKPTKSINEITNIIKNKSIVCFSSYNSISKNNSTIIKCNDISYKKLLLNCFVNDCATIDLKKYNNKIYFNYEKYENTCYWNLWLDILEKYGSKALSYNINPEWNYIRNGKKSQAMQRNKNIDLCEQYFNIKEFMISNHNLKISPNSIYKYNIKNMNIWWNYNCISFDSQIIIYVYIYEYIKLPDIFNDIFKIINNIKFPFDICIFYNNCTNIKIINNLKNINNIIIRRKICKNTNDKYFNKINEIICDKHKINYNINNYYNIKIICKCNNDINILF